MKKILLTLLFIFSFLNADITQYFPKLEGRIIDQVNLLSPAIKNDINSILKDHEKRKTNQIVVVILDSLHGYEIEDYSYQLGRYWGIGEKEKNNGVLLVISMAEKKIRIEVGYGLEGALTDKISHEIINYTIMPNFKAKQYELGVLKAVNEIILSIQGEYSPKVDIGDFSNTSKFAFLIPLIFFALMFLSMFANSISKKTKNLFFYKTSRSLMNSSFLGFLTFLISKGFTEYYLIVSVAIFVIVFLISYISIKSFNNLLINEYSNKGVNSKNLEEVLDTVGDIMKGVNSINKGFSGRGGNFGGGGASGGW